MMKLHVRSSLLPVLGMVLCLALTARAQQAPALAVTINVDAARDTLAALQNDSLTHDEALRIANLQGNQGILRKLHEFKITSTTDDFANALYKLARHEAVTKPEETSVLLGLVQPNVEKLKQLLAQMQANPENFQNAIKQRIAQFSLPDSKLSLQGYVVAGGDGGGYAFGSTDFYLNIGIIDDLVLARSVTTHEMYHAVQGAYANDREVKFAGPETSRTVACKQVEQLFANLYEEGSAVVVADPALIPQSHSAAAARMLADTDDGMKHLGTSATLLEMSVISLEAEKPMAYDDVYGVGFLGHGVLYNIGYAMAQSIVDIDGPAGLAKYLKEPPYRFVLRYTELPLYGKDRGHPALGEHTLAAAHRLAMGCR
ncbi:hypothetical protein SAMN05421819_0295 [Bryocella elongata]|uniref:DUF2268 domain-containing protein n=1 Tax=Bryocella elongata TaxID=863522 RepID=A0A1H5SQQ9_9BACT|nr:DUF5700 domain-containing putative Zn-dependent protease [Bryocella elongata]SEF52298.1 hypothetical protein SAMN05421819_0295 [Bryocella elongata]